MCPMRTGATFVDNDDYYYRYAPGAIYQVDRGTALISAVAALLTGGMTVGQQLPLGYSAYNVPMAYRSTYYDTPDAWYRYDNGYIYGVNPQTRRWSARSPTPFDLAANVMDRNWPGVRCRAISRQTSRRFPT